MPEKNYYIIKSLTERWSIVEWLSFWLPEEVDRGLHLILLLHLHILQVRICAKYALADFSANVTEEEKTEQTPQSFADPCGVCPITLCYLNS